MWVVVAFLSTFPAIRPARVDQVTVDEAQVAGDTFRVALRVPTPAPDDLKAEDFTLVTGGETIPATRATRWIDEKGPVQLDVHHVPADMTASIPVVAGHLGRDVKLELIPYDPAVTPEPTPRAFTGDAEHLTLIIWPKGRGEAGRDQLGARTGVSYRRPDDFSTYFDELRARWTVEWPAARLGTGYSIKARGVSSPQLLLVKQQPPDPPKRPSKKSSRVALVVIFGSLVMIFGIIYLAYRRRAR